MKSKKNIVVAIRPKDQWVTLPCRSVLTDFSVSYRYFNQTDLKPEVSSARISVRVSGDLFGLFLEGRDSFPALVQINDQLVYGGWVENKYSFSEEFISDDKASAKLNLEIKDWLYWFDYKLKESFNPYAELDVVNSLPICDPNQPNRSILHLLWSKLDVPFILDPALTIYETSRSFVIKEEENVLSCLKELFWSVGRYFYVDGLAVFKSKEIQTFPESLDDIPYLECISEMQINKSFRQYTSIKLEYANVQYKSAQHLEGESKPVYAEVGSYDKTSNETKPLAILNPETVYPDASITSEVYQKPKLNFLQTYYDTSLVEKGVFGTKGKENKDLSIVGMWQYKMRSEYEKGIEEIYFKERIDSFAFQFKNMLSREGEDWTKNSKKLWYFNIFANVLYRLSRNYIFLVDEVIPKVGMSQRSGLGDITARPLQEGKDLFAKYINDYITAKKFFDLQNSLLKKATHTFSWKSTKNLELDSFYKHRYAGKEFTLKVTSKEEKYESFAYSYTGISAFEITDYESESEGGGGASEKPPTDLVYNIANEFDGYDSFIKTNYLNDSNTLPSIDRQAQTFGAQIFLLGGVFFMSTYQFLSPIKEQNQATIRKRPLSEVTFKDKLSIVPIVNKIGVSVVCDITLGEDKIIASGKGQSLFKWI